MVRHARVLVAALVIGSAVLGVSTGQAEARDNHPADNGVRCAYYNQETGELEFYLPGQSLLVQDSDGRWHYLWCGEDGNWKDRTDDMRPTKRTSGR